MDQKILFYVALLLIAFVVGFLLVRFRSRKESGRYTAPKGEKLHISLETKDLSKTAEEILEGLGGVENVKAVSVDGTRLKAEILKYAAVNEGRLRESGVGGVIRPSKTMVHIIVGNQAADLAEAVREKMEL